MKGCQVSKWFVETFRQIMADEHPIVVLPHVQCDSVEISHAKVKSNDVAIITGYPYRDVWRHSQIIYLLFTNSVYWYNDNPEQQCIMTVPQIYTNVYLINEEKD